MNYIAGHKVGSDWQVIEIVLSQFGFEGASYGNDICPSFNKIMVPEINDTPAIEYRLWVAPQDIEERESDTMKRFTLTYGTYGEDTKDIFESDSLSELTQFIDDLNKGEASDCDDRFNSDRFNV